MSLSNYDLAELNNEASAAFNDIKRRAERDEDRISDFHNRLLDKTFSFNLLLIASQLAVKQINPETQLWPILIWVVNCATLWWIDFKLMNSCRKISGLINAENPMQLIKKHGQDIRTLNFVGFCVTAVSLLGVLVFSLTLL